MKKTFACGHRGLGQFCHRCKVEAQLEMNRKEAREQKKQVRASLPFSTKGLPHRVIEQGIELITRLERGESWVQLGGKVLQGNNSLISIRVNREYRLLLKRNGELTPLRILSHEDYNNVHTWRNL